MTEEDFDKCPKCGALPKFGLRCHPKWSVKVGFILGENCDMVAYYAHDRNSAEVLRDTLKKVEGFDILSFEMWNGDKWEEVQ